MITIDRSSNKALHEQLVEQLRYRIAEGHYKLNETLPSTRALAEQIGVSFHTVRKAYQQLEREGRLSAHAGSGYRVEDRAPLDKSQRIERGATVVQETLHQLIGLGLPEEEIEYLFQEQLEMLQSGRSGHKLVFVAAARELAEGGAEQIAHALQQRVEAASMDEVGRHQDADYVFAPFALVQRVMEALPRTDVIGVQTNLTAATLDRVARLLPRETLGLVTRSADAVAPLMNQLRTETGFGGQILASSIDHGAGQIDTLRSQTDLLLFTPACRRRLLSLLGNDEVAPIALVLSPLSLELLRNAVPA